MKTCSACQQTKPLSEFHNRSGSSDGLHGKCKVCIREGHARYAASRKGRDRLYRVRFGITIDDYEQMLAEQNGVCAICRQPDRTGKALAVDHDHTTGKVRGLLCHHCNVGIGHLTDVDALMSAVEYLLLQNETAVAIL